MGEIVTIQKNWQELIRPNKLQVNAGSDAARVATNEQGQNVIGEVAGYSELTPVQSGVAKSVRAIFSGEF